RVSRRLAARARHAAALMGPAAGTAPPTRARRGAPAPATHPPNGPPLRPAAPSPPTGQCCTPLHPSSQPGRRCARAPATHPPNRDYRCTPLPAVPPTRDHRRIPPPGTPTLQPRHHSQRLPFPTDGNMLAGECLPTYTRSHILVRGYTPPYR